MRLLPRTMNGQSPLSRANPALEKTRRRLLAGDLEGVGTNRASAVLQKVDGSTAPARDPVLLAGNLRLRPQGLVGG